MYFSHVPALNGDDIHSERKYKIWQKTFAHRSRPNHLCVSWDMFRTPVSDQLLTRALHRELDDATYYEPVADWVPLEKFREQAHILQQSGGE